MSNRKLAFGGAGALAALAVVGAALAAPVPATGRPLAPAVGYALLQGTHLALWAEDRGTGTGLDIYAVRTTASGVVVGIEIPIVVGPGDQSDPALAYNERQGEFLVVYTHSGGPGTTPTAGIPVPGTQPPPLTPPPPPPPPPPLLGAVAVDPRWEVARGPGQGTGPRPADVLPMADPRQDSDAMKDGQFRSPGAELNSAIQKPGVVLNDPLQPPPPVPTVASPTPTGPPLPQPTLPTPGGPTAPPPTSLPPPVGTLPVPPSTSPGPRDIYGLWVSESGIPLTVSFPILTSPADETYPSLAYRATQSADQWVLVWREVTGLSVALRTVEMAGFGRVMAFSSAVNTVVTGADHGRPSVAGSTDGEFLVAWSQSQPGRVDRDVLARRMNQNAFPVGSIISLVDSAEDQVYPSLGALRDTGDYLLAYEQRTAGAAPDIKIRRLNRNGIPLRAAYDVAGGPPFSFAPSLPVTDQPTMLLVWLDRDPASDHSVMGAEITREGRRIGPERPIIIGGAGSNLTPVVPPAPGTMPPPPPPPPPPVAP